MKIRNLNERLLLKYGFVANNSRYELRLENLDIEAYLIIEDGVMYGRLITPRLAYNDYDKDIKEFLSSIEKRDETRFQEINEIISQLLSVGAIELDSDDYDE